MEDLTLLTTEKRNPQSMHLDEASTLDILTLMNNEDAKVALAVQQVLPDIEKVVLQVIECLQKGGRLIYIGAGTSGRIGVLDAVECPPTFGMDPHRVIAFLAGGHQDYAKEEAEDSAELGKVDLMSIDLCSKDIVIGLAASGRTPYVIGALQYAHSIGATTASIACNPSAKISQYADYPIEVDNGPEILTGSTRLKAGTSQKMICNMISTASMIGLGKVYENLMVDVDVSNEKLYERWKNIVQMATGCDQQSVSDIYEKSHGHAKAAICMLKLDISYEQAIDLLQKNHGFIKKVIQGGTKNDHISFTR